MKPLQATLSFITKTALVAVFLIGPQVGAALIGATPS